MCSKTLSDEDIQKFIDMKQRTGEKQTHPIAIITIGAPGVGKTFENRSNNNFQ
jgi:hypothetical protein